MSDDATKTLYDRLGGYNAIAAVANDLLPRLRSDPQLGRFWAHRGEDGIMREKQLLIDFLCASAGGPMYYRGRDMTLTAPVFRRALCRAEYGQYWKRPAGTGERNRSCKT
jgi:truncated hemoglobin YjbI